MCFAECPQEHRRQKQCDDVHERDVAQSQRIDDRRNAQDEEHVEYNAADYISQRHVGVALNADGVCPKCGYRKK